MVQTSQMTAHVLAKCITPSPPPSIMAVFAIKYVTAFTMSYSMRAIKKSS